MKKKISIVFLLVIIFALANVVSNIEASEVTSKASFEKETKQVVTINDLNLKKEINKQIDSTRPATTDVTVEEMQTITRIAMRNASIVVSDLTGLEYAENLTEITLTNATGLSDITPVSKLKNLTLLNLYDSSVQDFSMFENENMLNLVVRPTYSYEGFGNYAMSEINNDSVNQISEKFPNLTVLHLNGALNGSVTTKPTPTKTGKITNIDSLSKLVNLKHLSVGGNQITDFSSVPATTSLGSSYGQNFILDTQEVPVIAGTTQSYKLPTITMVDQSGVSHSQNVCSFNGLKPDLNYTLKCPVALIPGASNSFIFQPVSTSSNIIIKFNSSDGTGMMENQTIPYGNKAPLSDNLFTKDSHKFIGWNTLKDGTGTAYDNLAEYDTTILTDKYNVELFAQWEKDQYTLTYDKNSGTGDMSQITVNAGESVTILDSTFTKEGYTFGSWNTKIDGTGTSFNVGDLINPSAITKAIVGDIKLYAQWIPNNYIIEFDANTGAGIMENQIFTYDTPQLIALNTFTKEGFKFVGWNTKVDGTGTNYTDAQSILNILTTGNQVLYAQWQLSMTEINPSIPVEPSVPVIPLDPSTEVKPIKPSVEEELEDTGVTTSIMIYSIILMVVISLSVVRKTHK